MAALAHGRPIVTTHGPTEVPELKGVLHTVHAGDPDALVEGIKAVWIDKDYRDQLGREALKANEHFSWSTIAAQTLALFESVISQQ